MKLLNCVGVADDLIREDLLPTVGCEVRTLSLCLPKISIYVVDEILQKKGRGRTRVSQKA